MKKLVSLLWAVTLLAALALSACSSNQATEALTGGDENLSLDKEFGGFGGGDESPGFGDPELMNDSPEDAQVSDVIADEPAVIDAMSSDSPVKAFFLRITWGLLEGDSSATEVIDWSGSAEVSRGTLLVLRTIRFEGNDFVHLPRDSRQKVEFTSQTKRHFDGLLLAIIDNDTTASDTDATDGTFTFVAGSFSKVLNFSELDSLDLLEPVGDMGNEVSIVTRAKDIVPFAGGFFAGRWVKTRRDGGEFKGRWINSLGTNTGFLRGIWGINRFGNKVFKGKYISANGEFRGLLAGQWTFTRGDRAGVFEGRWVNRQHKTVGRLKGHFRTGRAGDRRGHFEGRYRVTHRENAEGSDS
ncbi:MAG: hypothetical protein D6743_18835 [Calditrichaeota bacterium]|nr:MAG: hypothetical protein D6743_18835 [Calditrichota bacterium]